MTEPAAKDLMQYHDEATCSSKFLSRSILNKYIAPKTNSSIAKHLKGTPDTKIWPHHVCPAMKKKTAQLKTEQGVPLAPSHKDIKPWYSERDKGKEHQEEKSK
ncbi:hypothetical protein BDR04DRAFT_1116631 [Suillus decipiens]|nr:hypothetical protein BDR04DRAFT_1116631 [Suillus decipiens]